MKMIRLISLTIFSSLTLLFVNQPNQVGAVDAFLFNPGNIIDDSVMTNNTAMSVSQIQDFLDSKIASCDTWGSGSTSYYYNASTGRVRSSWFEGGTYVTTSRATYGQRYNAWTGTQDASTPFTCLNNYKAPDGRTAAQLIYDASQKWRINPQVFIVLLQKEQGLVTDTWPWPIQYKTATGYGCPDTAPCDSQYFGLANQLDWAGKLFRSVINQNPDWYSPYVVGENYIQWSPNSSCGGSWVNIENWSTAALYNYTPYRPNHAALSAGYGTGDSCSAYGNRNFFLYFSDWFGSVRGSISTTGLFITKDALGQMFTGDKVNIKFTLNNRTNMTFVFNQVGVAIRGPEGQNLDPGWSGRVSIPPGASYTYSKSFTPTQEGEYKIYMSSFAERDNGWRECHLDNSQSTCYMPHIVQHPIEILETPQVVRTTTNQAISELRQKQSYKISYTLKNTSQRYNARPGAVMIASRTSSGANRDMIQQDPGELTPGQEYQYSSSASYNDSAGTKYNFYVSTTKDKGRTYEEQQFKPANSSVSQNMVMIMRDGVTLIRGPEFDGVGVKGARTDVSFKIKNYTDKPVDLGRVGLIVRGPQGQNLDTGWHRVDNLSPNDDGTYTYQASFWPTVTGNWSVRYSHVSADMKVWNTDYPKSETSDVRRSDILPVTDKSTLLDGPSTTNSNPHVGQAVPVTFRIKTSSDKPVDLGRVGLIVRGPQGQNLDTGWHRVNDFSTANESGIYKYQAEFYPSVPGEWKITYSHVTNDMKRWNINYPISDSSSVNRTITINVKPQVTVTTGVSLTGRTLGLHQAMFTMTNHGSRPIDLGKVGLAVRDPSGLNRDAWWEDFTIPAGSSRAHTVPVNFNKTGQWSFSIARVSNGVWSTPALEHNDIISYLVVDVR